MPILGVSSDFISKWKKVFFQNGSSVMLEIAKCLERFQKLQLIFICGRNEELASILLG